MFNFRLINTPDGNQIIDTTLKTPCESLTPLQMVEYIEMDTHLAFMERLERKKKRVLKHKQENNPLWKLACFCGIV